MQSVILKSIKEGFDLDLVSREFKLTIKNLNSIAFFAVFEDRIKLITKNYDINYIAYALHHFEEEERFRALQRFLKFWAFDNGAFGEKGSLKMFPGWYIDLNAILALGLLDDVIGRRPGSLQMGELLKFASDLEVEFGKISVKFDEISADCSRKENIIAVRADEILRLQSLLDKQKNIINEKVTKIKQLQDEIDNLNTEKKCIKNSIEEKAIADSKISVSLQEIKKCLLKKRNIQKIEDYIEALNNMGFLNGTDWPMIQEEIEAILDEREKKSGPLVIQNANVEGDLVQNKYEK